MKNAQKEFLQFTKFRKVKCVAFTVNKVQCNLRVGHTPEEYEEFLRKLDIDYDCEDVYAIMGFIWFEEEDTWGERTVYGEWELCWKPEIPHHLKPLTTLSSILKNVSLPSDDAPKTKLMLDLG